MNDEREGFRMQIKEERENHQEQDNDEREKHQQEMNQMAETLRLSEFQGYKSSSIFFNESFDHEVLDEEEIEMDKRQLKLEDSSIDEHLIVEAVQPDSIVEGWNQLCDAEYCSQPGERTIMGKDPYPGNSRRSMTQKQR